jgi:hypothetical protein
VSRCDGTRNTPNLKTEQQMLSKVVPGVGIEEVDSDNPHGQGNQRNRRQRLPNGSLRRCALHDSPGVREAFPLYVGNCQTNAILLHFLPAGRRRAKHLPE